MSLGTAYGHGPVTFDGDITVGAVTIDLISASPIPVGKVVAIEAGGGMVVADSSNLAHADRIVGIAVASGTRVLTNGEITGVGGVNQGDILFVDENGDITTTPPTSGFQQIIAVATSSQSVVVSTSTAILL